MNVDIASAATHVAMEQCFGLPTPADPDLIELFGPYHFGGETRFWCYDPAGPRWEVKGERWPLSAPFPHDLGSSASVLHSLEDLSLIQRPPVPERFANRPTPFLYDGWLFLWSYLQTKRKWDVVPITRWDATPDPADSRSPN